MKTFLRDVVRKAGAGGLLAITLILCLLTWYSVRRTDGPAVAVLDTDGVIHLFLYPSPSDHPAPARFAGGLAIARTSDGSILVVARDRFDSVWANLYVPKLRQWQEWWSGHGIFVGEPALVVDRQGSGWVALRDRFNTYWVARTDIHGSFGAWKGLGGVFSTDPIMVTCSDGSNYLFGLDAGHALWNARLVNGVLDGTWVLRGGVLQGVPAATCGGDGAVYLAARDQWNAIWLARLARDAWTGWISGGRVFATDPRLAALGNKIALVALDGNHVPWFCTIPDGTPSALATCSQAGGALDAVAATGWQGELFIAGLSLDNGVRWWRQSRQEWSKAELTAKGVAIAIR